MAFAIAIAKSQLNSNTCTTHVIIDLLYKYYYAARGARTGTQPVSCYRAIQSSAFTKLKLSKRLGPHSPRHSPPSPPLTEFRILRVVSYSTLCGNFLFWFVSTRGGPVDTAISYFFAQIGIGFSEFCVGGVRAKSEPTRLCFHAPTGYGYDNHL